jgi:hypothetical protein
MPSLYLARKSLHAHHLRHSKAPSTQVLDTKLLQSESELYIRLLRKRFCQQPYLRRRLDMPRDGDRMKNLSTLSYNITICGKCRRSHGCCALDSKRRRRRALFQANLRSSHRLIHNVGISRGTVYALYNKNQSPGLQECINNNYL